MPSPTPMRINQNMSGGCDTPPRAPQWKLRRTHPSHTAEKFVFRPSSSTRTARVSPAFPEPCSKLNLGARASRPHSVLVFEVEVQPWARGRLARIPWPVFEIEVRPWERGRLARIPLLLDTHDML